MVVTAPPLDRSVTKVDRLLPLRMYDDSMLYSSFQLPVRIATRKSSTTPSAPLTCPVAAMWERCPFTQTSTEAAWRAGGPSPANPPRTRGGGGRGPPPDPSP